MGNNQPAQAPVVNNPRVQTPKRRYHPANPFILYYQDVIRQNRGNMFLTAKICGQRWKALPEAQKNVYRKRYARNVFLEKIPLVRLFKRRRPAKVYNVARKADKIKQAAKMSMQQLLAARGPVPQPSVGQQVAKPPVAQSDAQAKP